MKMILKISIVVMIAFSVVIWGYGLSIEVPEPYVSEMDTHDSVSRFEWKFEEQLLTEVAHIPGEETPLLVERRKFDRELAASPGMEIEFIPLLRIPHYAHYDEYFAKTLNLGLMVKAPDKPVKVGQTIARKGSHQ